MSARKSARKSVKPSGKLSGKLFGKLSGKQPSVWLRRLKAKLPLLKRPTVWASGLLLLLPLIFLASYLRDPARFASSLSGDTTSPEAAPPLSDPSSLLEASNLDSQPLDSQPLDSQPLDSQPAETGTQPSIFQTDLLSALLANSGSDSAPKPSALDKAQPKPGQGDNASPAQPSVDPNLFSSGLISPAPTSASLPVSSLQSALDRSLGVASSSNNSPSSPLNAQLQSQPPAQTDTRARTNADLIQIYGQQPFSQFSQLEQPYRPATSPQVGSTGYVLPPALRTPSYVAPAQNLPSPFSNQFSNQFSAPSVGSYSSPAISNPGAYPQPSFASPQPLAQPSPFSVPRTPPGRYIGNGQINTFSNP